MADSVALTGIVVSGVLGPSVGAWWALRRLRTEHENARVLADRADLRVVLPEMARDLSRAGRMRGAVQGQFFTHGASAAVKAQETVANLNEAARDVDLHSATLSLRLGAGHPITEAYVRAFDALREASSAVALAYGPGAIDGREAWEQLKRSDEAFASAQADFLDEAHKVAASQLEPRRRRRRFLARRTTSDQEGTRR